MGVLAVRLSRHMAALGLLVGLASCGSFPLSFSEVQSRLEVAPYQQQPLSEAWVSAPHAQLVLRRHFGSVTEQRILLPNSTAIAGENFILLRSEKTLISSGGRLLPEKLLRSTDGAPYPFGEFKSLTFKSSDDLSGTLNWATWTNNAGLTCVLAFRRLEATSRIVLPGTAAMDMMLRNCVHGSEENALAPIGPEVSGFSAVTADKRNSPHMLSPLAGPLP